MTLPQLIYQSQQFIQTEAARLNYMHFETDHERQATLESAKSFLTLLNTHIELLAANQAQLESASEVSQDYALTVSFLYGVAQQISQLRQLIDYFKQKFRQFVPSALDAEESQFLDAYVQSLAFKQQKGQSQLLSQRKENFAQILSLAQLGLTYLHDVLRTSANFVQSRIQPRYAVRQFKRLVANGQIPLSAQLNAYPKYVFLGSIFKPKYGYYVDCVEASNTLEVIAREKESSKTTEIFVVLGRIFVQGSKELDAKLNEGLKSARIAAAVNADGEISIPVLVTRGEMQAVQNALLEYVRKVVAFLRQQNTAIPEYNIYTYEDIFKALRQLRELQKNNKLLELIDEAMAKTRDHLLQVRWYRSSRKHLVDQMKGHNAALQGVVIECAEPTRQDFDRERIACRDLAQNYAWLTTVCRYLQFIEASAVYNEEINWVEQDAHFMEEQRQLMQNTQNYLFESTDLPTEFSLRNIEQDLGGRSRNLQVYVKIMANGKLAAQTAVPFLKAVDIDVSPQHSRLGFDLSAGEKPIYAQIYHKIGQKLPKLSVVLQIGSATGEVGLPIKEGEDRNAVDFTSYDLSFCVGYYMKTGSLEVPDRRQPDFANMKYDPNLVVPIIQNQPTTVQYAAEGEQKTVLNLETYKRMLRKHYELDKTKPETQLDPLNYVNLVEKTTGDKMDQIAVDPSAKRRKQLLADRENRIGYSCKDQYKGILGETLFLYQYLRNLKQFYDRLLDDKTRQEKLQVVFPNFTSIRNPLIIPPFTRNSRPLYPVRVQERERTKIMYQRYENQYQQAAPLNFRFLTQQDATKLLLTINYINLKALPPSPDTQYYLFARVTGNADPDIQIGPCTAVKNNVQINYYIEFRVPLPRAFREGQEAPLGYDQSDEAFAQFPFSLKLILFYFDTKYSSWTSMGQIILPLRTIFLRSRIEGELYFQAFDISMISSFKPPRVLLKAPELYFCVIDASSFSGALPDDFSAKYQQILALNTRLGELSAQVLEQERAQLQALSAQRRNNYYMKYATKLTFAERGITLFAQTLNGTQLFLSQFVPTPLQCDNLANELNIKTELDCVLFAVAVPFVPDCFSRSYTTQKIGQFMPETRMRAAEVFALCGGDYFEHACVLCGLLNSRAISAYVARVCTQTLCNEYFVLVVRESTEASYFIDPVHAVRFPFFSPVITRLIELFDAAGIYVNGGIDMRPSSVVLDTYIHFKTQPSDAKEMLTDLIPRKEAGQEEALQNALVYAIRNDFSHRREPQNTMFDEAVSAQLTQGHMECLNNFAYYLVTLKCAYEDAAILLEKINQTQIYNTQQKVQFAIAVSVKGFGNRFAALDVKLARLAHKDGGVQQSLVQLEGGKFGTQM